MEPAREHLAAQPEPIPLERDGAANPQLLPWMHQGIPPLPIESCQEQTLDRTATRHTAAKQSRREHPGIVDDEQVARPQQIGQVGDGPVAHDAAVAVENQQPGRLTVRRRSLGDTVRR